MPKPYKRKRLAEEWSLDLPPKKIKKNLNSSERWRGKRAIDKELQEMSYSAYQDDLDRWNEEIAIYENISPCAECLMDYAVEDKLKTTFLRLGIVVLIDHYRHREYCEHNKPDTATTQKSE